MGTHKWTVAEAKAKFSEVIERAQSDGPQTITRKGRRAAVVVGAEEWERKTKAPGQPGGVLRLFPTAWSWVADQARARPAA